MTSSLTNEAKAELMRAARDVQRFAYAPYSKFFVGSALLASSGKVYLGVNVENASYPVACCAERSAIGAAVTAGERSFVAVAVATDAPSAVFPCGMCAQALRELGPALLVLAAGKDGVVAEAPLSAILPHAYAGEGLAAQPPDRADAGAARS